MVLGREFDPLMLKFLTEKADINVFDNLTIEVQVMRGKKTINADQTSIHTLQHVSGYRC